MRVSILVVYLTMLDPVVQARGVARARPPRPISAAGQAPEVQISGADSLYVQRENLERARRAVEIWDNATKRTGLMGG
jgi:hypothetical protein